MASGTGTIELALSIRHAFLAAFAVGVLVGGFGMAELLDMGGVTGALVAGTGSTGEADSGAPEPAPSPSPSPSGGSGSGGVSVSQVDTAGEPVIGNEDAPVTIVYWGDFQCPFCKRFEQQTFSQLLQNEIQDGKVRLVFKDFQFLGPDSTTGGIASECAWNQVQDGDTNAYWNWHTSMYNNQDGENSGWGAQSDIVSMTENVDGVDADQLQSCMNNQQSELQQELSEDRSQGQRVGISGTPGFVIYKTGSDTGVQITGAQPYTRFQSAISQVQNGGVQDSGSQREADKTIEVSGTEYSFSPSTITVDKGQTVRIKFTNTGKIPHNLKIPDMGVGTRTIQPGQTDTFTFTAPKTGTFPIQFICSLPGHAQNGMTGQVTSQ